MKNIEFASAIWLRLRRAFLTCVLLFAAVADSFFTFHSSILRAQVIRGKASFYSRRATGSRTANGERLHHDSMTCAHRTLPFGTLLKVTHIGNDRSVIVRVNDRGPYVRGRIIDLSWGAAKKLDMIGQGIAMVFVEPADRITIPLLPHDHPELAKFEFEVRPLVDSIMPSWQYEVEHEREIVHPKSKGNKKQNKEQNKAKKK